jgi:hypothetical protein
VAKANVMLYSQRKASFMGTFGPGLEPIDDALEPSRNDDADCNADNECDDNDESAE